MRRFQGGFEHTTLRYVVVAFVLFRLLLALSYYIVYSAYDPKRDGNCDAFKAAQPSLLVWTVLVNIFVLCASVLLAIVFGAGTQASVRVLRFYSLFMTFGHVSGILEVVLAILVGSREVARECWRPPTDVRGVTLALMAGLIPLWFFQIIFGLLMHTQLVETQRDLEQGEKRGS